MIVESNIEGVTLKLQTGKTPPSKEEKYFNGEVNWYTPTDLKTKLLGRSKRTITELAYIDKRALIYPRGTVLLSCIGDIGKLGITTDDKSSSNQQITGLIPDKTKITSEYLYYWCLAHKYIFESKRTSVTVPMLNNKRLRKIKIQYAKNIGEQIKIANLLSQVEALIAKQKESIKLFDELLKSTFLDMFGDPIANPQSRDEVRLDEIVVLQRGFDLPKSQRSTNGNIPLYGSNGIVDFHDESKFEEGIITGRSGTIGKVYYSYEPFWPLNTTLFSKDTKGNNIIYLAYLLDLFKLERFHQGAGVPTLNRNNVHKEKIYKVDRSEQDKFATIVQQVNATKEHYQNSLDELNELFGSLSQRAFRGELDLSKIINVKVSDTSSLDVSSSRAEDLKELLNVPTFMRKEIGEEKDAINQKKHKNMTSEELNKLIEELNVNRKAEPKKDIEELLLQLLNGNIALNAKEKGNLISGFTFGEIRDKLFELLDNKKITQTFVYKPHSKAEKEIAYVGLKQN